MKIIPQCFPLMIELMLHDFYTQYPCTVSVTQFQCSPGTQPKHMAVCVYVQYVMPSDDCPHAVENTGLCQQATLRH